MIAGDNITLSLYIIYLEYICLPYSISPTQMLKTELFTELSKFKDSVDLSEIKELIGPCKTIIKRCLDGQDLPVIKIAAVYDYAYEQVNIGNWKNVKPYLRKTITIASYLQVLLNLKDRESPNLTEKLIKTIFALIDHGLLFGYPLAKEPLLLQNCASILNKKCNELYPLTPRTGDTKDITPSSSNTLSYQPTGIQLDVLNCPSMELFYRDYILMEKPVVLDNCINHWPALVKWRDKDYLLRFARFRTVPIELGSKYTDSEWTQKLMTLGEFMEQHVYSSSETTGYLAQCQLFDQIPELKADIAEPEYCCFTESDEPVNINAWYGPKGTVSPLHHDPKRNLLAQVVGEKLIFLFSPSDSEYLYPHEEELLNNTARVDPREPDLEKYPNYKEAKVYYCVLRPGQMLFIPPKWWHFVESLSVSFSVSFWWE